MRKRIAKYSLLSLAILALINIGKGYGSIKKHKDMLDIQIQKLSTELEKREYDKACSTSQRTYLLIKRKIWHLKRIEPYYNWQEMQKLFKHLPIANCNKKHNKNDTSFLGG